jgi:hypothetical protein
MTSPKNCDKRQSATEKKENRDDGNKGWKEERNFLSLRQNNDEHCRARWRIKFPAVYRGEVPDKIL